MPRFFWIFLFLAPALLQADQVCGGQVCVDALEERGLVRFSANNKGPATVTMRLKVNVTNMTANVPLPYTTVLKPGRTRLFSLRIANRNKHHDFSYEFRYQYGNMNAVHDSTVYSLPFAPGQRYPILQGYNGSFSHTGNLAWAIDWDVPEGTPVHAARGGIVILTEDRFTVGAPDRRLFTKANHVLIQHSDGTVGEYFHLKPQGVVVKVGQQVKEGELIGYSGHTGFSTQPHLHFHVSQALSGSDIKTLRVYYRSEGSNAQTLQYGKIYRAVPPLAQTESYRPSGSLPEILLCASLEDGVPVDQKAVFSPAERVVVHFSFDPGASQRLKVLFRRAGGETVHEDSILTETSWDYAYIALNLERVTDPRGRWEAVTFVNDAPASSLQFEVR